MKSCKDLLGFVFFTSAVLSLSGALLSGFFALNYIPLYSKEHQMIQTRCKYVMYPAKAITYPTVPVTLLLPRSDSARLRDVEKQNCEYWDYKTECAFSLGKEKNASHVRYYYEMEYYNKTIVLPRIESDEYFKDKIKNNATVICYYDEHTAQITHLSQYYLGLLRFFMIGTIVSFCVMWLSGLIMLCLKKRNTQNSSDSSPKAYVQKDAKEPLLNSVSVQPVVGQIMYHVTPQQVN